MDLLPAAILGLVQALTEFLPVSSSGHLVLSKILLGLETEHGAAFEVAVHFGTLLSVLVVFRREVGGLIKSAWAALTQLTRIKERWDEDEELRLLGAIFLGCIPAGVVGLTFKDQLEAAFDSPMVVCIALIGTGFVLLATVRAPQGERGVSLGAAAVIGVAQAVAIIPGVSRSGSTIAAAMFLGVERERAARYSFLLSLPVIAGATLLKARELLETQIPSDTWWALGVGAAVSFIAGIGALLVLMSVVRRGGFAHFGWYCLLIGIGGLIAL
mgnify:CR=1 FL=1